MEKKYQKELNLNGNIFEYDKSMKDYLHRLTDDGWVSETILFKVMNSHFIEEIMNTEVEIYNTEEIILLNLEKYSFDSKDEFAIDLVCKINEIATAINKMKEGKE